MDKRLVQRRNSKGKFETVSFRELKKGDEFVMFESTGEPVERQGCVFLAASNARPGPPRSLDSEQLKPGEEDPWVIETEKIV